MKNAIGFMLLFLLEVSHAHASPPLILRETGVGATRTRVVETGASPQSFGFHSYDNWRFQGAIPPLDPGITIPTGTVQIGGNEVGDDVNLVSWQPSRIVDHAYTMMNYSVSQSITAIQVSFRFYSLRRTLLGEATYTTSGYTIPPGGAAFIYSDGGSDMHWFLPAEESMFMTIQFSNAVNYDVSQMGLYFGSPVTTGSSSRFIENFTTGQTTDVGEGNNLCFFIDTIPVPGTSSLAIMLGALPLSLRRRRK